MENYSYILSLLQFLIWSVNKYYRDTQRLRVGRSPDNKKKQVHLSASGQHTKIISILKS